MTAIGFGLGLMVTYFFFGPATLANLESRFLAAAIVPLGEATVPRDGCAPERGGGLISALALAAVFTFFFGWSLPDSGLASE